MTREVAVVAMPNVQLLDVSGPLDVFAEANVQARAPAYRLRVLSARPGPVRSSSGVRLLHDGVVTETAPEGIDTLLVAGSPNAPDEVPDPRVARWLRAAAAASRRYGSVCTGAFVLAQAGLLDGKRVTTHWAVADRLTEQFPTMTVEADAIHVQDGKVWTAAGVTAGMDLSLALVEEDLGRETARKVASQLVMFFKRPGGQTQFSSKGEAVPVGRSALQEIQRYVAAHPAEDHRVELLASRMGLSARHFARLFRKEVGLTPAEWVEQVRIAAARTMLESGQWAPKEVAGKCGFHDVDTLRRAFLRRVGISPSEYRKHYAGPARQAP
jgi:transcriptional regulator GlxA family with amidase domain